MSSIKKNRQILFLYSELAEYFLACLRELQKDTQSDIHVVHFPVNPEAPFRFALPAGISFYKRENYSSASRLAELVKNIKPDLIYCSGWIDKSYLRICRSLDKKIPLILALDNPWKGSLRQQVAAASGFLLTNIFTHTWVPGRRQKLYAEKIGFKDQQILTGVYSADYELFHSHYEKNKPEKNKNFPRKFLFVGRYARQKGIEELISSFSELQNKKDSGWELWCAGAGTLPALKNSSPKIKDLGFIQPGKMGEVIAQTGVFILPSRYEPWGVVAHEFAAAGFPLICSEEVGAAELFLKDTGNGFLFHSGNTGSLKEALQKIMDMDEAGLRKMGERSAELASRYTPVEWTKKITSLL